MNKYHNSKRKYFPSLEEFKKKATQGNLIPVYSEILADMETPVSAFKKIGKNKCSFLLESMEGGEKWARYSFIGFDPAMIFKSKGRRVELTKNGDTEVIEDCAYPLDVLKDIMNGYRVVEVEGLPRFFGGAVGYLSYDMVRFIEHLPDQTIDDLNLYDSIFLISETILIFDNLNNSIKIVYNVHVDNEEHLDELYHSAQKKIPTTISLLRKPSSYQEINSSDTDHLEITSNIFTKGYKI